MPQGARGRGPEHGPTRPVSQHDAQPTGAGTAHTEHTIHEAPPRPHAHRTTRGADLPPDPGPSIGERTSTVIGIGVGFASQAANAVKDAAEKLIQPDTPPTEAQVAKAEDDMRQTNQHVDRVLRETARSEEILNHPKSQDAEESIGPHAVRRNVRNVY